MKVGRVDEDTMKVGRVYEDTMKVGKEVEDTMKVGKVDGDGKKLGEYPAHTIYMYKYYRNDDIYICINKRMRQIL